VQLILLNMHLASFEWMTVEWVAVAFQLVGTTLAPFVSQLPEDCCLSEFFGGIVAEPDVLLTIRVSRHELRGAVVTHNLALDFLDDAIARSYRAQVAFRDHMTRSPTEFSDVRFRQYTVDLENALDLFKESITALSRSSLALLDVYFRLATLFGQERVLTRSWFFRRDTVRLMEVMG
jgi:hypothetical protein